MKVIATVGLVVALIAMGAAEQSNAQNPPDQTPITRCEDLPASAHIEVFSRSETKEVCLEVSRILEGVTVDDLVTFEKASFLLSVKGYKKDDYKQITAELVDIIRLRGLYDKQPRWKPTLDLVYKSYVAFNGIVKPSDIDLFLRGAGPMAKTLSDEGLLSMIIYMKQKYQRGDE